MNRKKYNEKNAWKTEAARIGYVRQIWRIRLAVFTNPKAFCEISELPDPSFEALSVWAIIFEKRVVPEWD